MVRPNPANVFMLFLLAFNVLLVFITSYVYWSFWHGTEQQTILESPLFLVGGQVVGFLLPVLIFSAASPERMRIPKAPVGLVNIVLVMALSLFLQPLMMLISGISSLFVQNPVPGMMSSLMVLPLPVALAVIALTPAVCEELAFRGFIQTHYEAQAQPIALTAVVNGLFFGIIHLNIHQFGYAFFMGIIFAYMVYYTQSVFAAMLSHFVLNASQFILAYFSPYGVSDTPPDSAEIIAAIMQIGLIALFTAPVPVALAYAFIRHNRGKNPVAAEVRTYAKPFDIAFWAVIVLYVLLVAFVF